MDREDYWSRKETEIGETVDAKFYCTYLKGDWPVKGPLTGVLYFSKTRLFFQSFYSPKSLASMLRPGRQEDLSEGHAFQMPLKNGRCSFDESARNFWSRLFAAPEQPFVIHRMDGERETGRYQFSVDRKQLKKIVDLIRSNRSGAHGQ